MSFLSPLLLSGLALASVPVIIHLLNRRRFIRIDWAPMEYLKLTIRKNRKRIQLEQWLLLAVRVLAVAALFFAVARPTISNNAVAQLLAAQGRAARFVVIDDSLSMGALSAGKSALARAKDAAIEALKHVEPQDTVTLMTALQAETPLVRDAHLDQVDAVTNLVRSLEITQAFGQWGSIFEKIDAHVQRSSQPVREVLLITDLRATGWDAGVNDVVDRWATGNVSLRIFDVGGTVSGNVVLKSLEQTVPLALVHTPVSFLARIHNDGGDRTPAQEATLTVDGKPQSIQLPEVPAKGDIDLPVTVTFDSPGMHGVELALPRDNLPEDNVRYVSVDVRSSLGIEVVDGEPDPRPFESETDFLELAYSVGRQPWQITRMTDSQWASNPLLAPDVLVLANVGSISEQRAAELTAQVEAGLGLMIFLGEQVDPTAYNRVLYREGRGLLPAEIVRYREEEATGLVLENFADSPLAPLTRLKSNALAKIRPKRFAEVSVAADAGDAVRVLARWNDSRQSPAIVEKRIGEGRVLLWTITADKKWSDWPTDGSYVLAVRQAAMAIAAHATDRDNVTAGQPLRFRLDKKGIPLQAGVKLPGRDDPQVVAVDRTDPKLPQLRFDKTARAGFYHMEWKDPVMGSLSRLFAASPDVRESNLAPIPTSELKNLIGKLNPQIVRLGENKAGTGAAGTELWRTAIWCLLGLIVVESCLAAWVGRESR
jgi:Aerotolerance regulator N-terminal